MATTSLLCRRFALALLAGFAIHAAAHADDPMRCGTRLIQAGGNKDEVLLRKLSFVEELDELATNGYGH